MKKKRLLFIILCICLVYVGQVLADWPMPGHDPQRTSCSTESIGVCDSPVWCVQFDPYIPSRACIITKEAEGGVPDTVYVTAADGIYALYPDTGAQRWYYPMSPPPGDVPTVVGTTLYVCGTDKTIHAVNCANGNNIWQTDSAGAAFYVNPLVVNGSIYAGSLDGYFYCFDASDGSLNWYYDVGERIYFSAAYETYGSYPNGLVFFGASDCRAYALRADTGAYVWDRALPGDNFDAFWPVVGQGRVMFVNCNSYPQSYDLRGLHREILLIDVSTVDDGNGNYNLQHHIDWLNTYPDRNTFYVLDPLDGTPEEQSPFLYWGNPAGQRFPAAVATDGKIWLDTPWQDDWFGKGRYGGWNLGSNLLKYTTSWESTDEPQAHAIIGNYIYNNDGGDGCDKGNIWSISSGSVVGSWTNATFRTPFGNYWGNWDDRQYGNNFVDGGGSTWAYVLGHHGHQPPPTPLNGKVYIHRSNAVICMQP